MKYEAYTPTGSTARCWTRSATANQEFNVADTKNHKYLIKFDKNFTKEHLITYSKNQLKVDAEAFAQSLRQMGVDEIFVGKKHKLSP
jgi:hypothetical protein